MSFLLRYRLPALVLFFAALGLALSAILKLGELKWYYIVGTPLIALIIGLLGYFFTSTIWNSKLKGKSGLITAALYVLFFIALIIHVWVYFNGTFRYEDVNKVTRTYLKGYKYTEMAEQFKKDNPSINSDADLLYEGFGGIDGKADVWTTIGQTTLHFIISYLAAILFFSALIAWVLGVAYEKRYADPQKAIQVLQSEKGLSNYEKYLLSFSHKLTDEKYKMIKAHIFLSYASKQRKIAEDLAHSLANAGHMVFFDRTNLPPGLEYNAAINSAIRHSDLFIFLVSPDSIAEGHYTLSELKFAGETWPAATGVLLPVMCEPTGFDAIPSYAKSVTVLVPSGNLVAEVTSEVEKLYKPAKRLN